MSINSTRGVLQLNFACGLVVITRHREDLMFISLYSISRVEITQRLRCEAAPIQMKRSGTFVVNGNYVNVYQHIFFLLLFFNRFTDCSSFVLD